MKRLLLLTALLVACGDDIRAYTWGSMVDEVVTAYCQAGAACGYTDDVDTCIVHSRFHLCELPDSCDVELDDSAADVAAACADALLPPDETVCSLLFFGVSPDGCSEFFDYTPEGN